MSDMLEIDIRGEYKPIMVIVSYRKDNDFYLETHDILESGNIGAGKPLSEYAVRKIADSFTSKKLKRKENDSMILKGFLPDNLLYLDQNTIKSSHIAWFMDKRKADLYFDKKVRIKDGKGNMPMTLFIWNGFLSIYSIKRKPESLSDNVYEAPFPNISNDGSVCLGNTKRQDKPKTFETAIKVYETAFFQSRFTDEGLDRRLANISMVQLWKENMASKKEFNDDYLKPHGKYKTIEDVIKAKFGKEALSR